MDDAKQQLVEKLQTANNVLVTVSRNPSVDQLASCIGLTLLLNKLNKHAAAVFSGQVPSTIEFLQPEETLEKNTDSLRDFIIALDKSKADKLRYKVEDNVVRIFITPYRTSISQADLEFSEGDFNVDVVVALGVRQQEDLDEAITAHGRILHDATVASLNVTPETEVGLGAINWYDPQASSLSELVADLAQALGGDLLDNQIATALLTGIVAETGRFSNEKTRSQTMSVSAALMAAGADQQLVATKLQEGGHSFDVTSSIPSDQPEDGTLRIDHEEANPEAPLPTAVAAQEPAAKQQADDGQAAPSPSGPPAPSDGASLSPGARLLTEPPTLGGTLTANTFEEGFEPTTDPLSLPSAEPPQLLDRKPEPFVAKTEPPTGLSLPPAGASPSPFVPAPDVPSPAPTAGPLAPPVAPLPPAPTPPPAAPAATAPTPDGETLSDLEKSVDSPHLQAGSLDTARDEVNKALSDAAAHGLLPDEPVQAISAQPLGDPLHPDNSQPAPPAGSPPGDDANAPPPVPPPIPFQFGNPPTPPNSQS